MTKTDDSRDEGRSRDVPAHRRAEPTVRRYEYDHIDGGTLVYVVLTEHRDHLDSDVRVSRRLHGFVNVTDWDAIRSELARRGHDVGSIHQLPVMDEDL